MKRLFILLILIVAFASCKNEKREDAVPQKELADRISVNPSEAKDLIISDLYESVDFIPITSTNQVLIHQIEKVREIGDTLVIMTEQEIWFINGEGEILNRIEAIGQGPGEYEMISDLLLDAENKTVEILDGDVGKIIAYSFNGEFLYEWKNTAFHMAKSFAKISDEIYTIYGGVSFEMNTAHRLLYVSKPENKIINKFFPIGKEARFAVFLDRDNFWRLGKDLYFSFTFQDTVYRLGEEGPQPYLGFDYGKYTLPGDIMEGDFSDVMEFIEYCRQTPAAYQAANFFETDKLFFFTFEHQSRRYQGYFDKRNADLKIVSGLTTSEGDEIDDDLYYFLKYPRGVGERALYFEIEPYDMIVRFNEIKQKVTEGEWERLLQKHKPVMDLYQSLSKDDNNILIRAVLNPYS